jgi:Tol biopolymer transport system component
MILGTAAYMSPEQARGKSVDRRADIWAFGCVLYETLSGKKPFAGDTVSDAIATILTAEPDWNALPAATPPRIRVLLRRCLQKDSSRRYRDIGDVSLDIEEGLAELSGTSQPVARFGPGSASVERHPATRWLVTALLVLGAASGTWVFRGMHPSEVRKNISVYRLTDFVGLEEFPAISPDGKSVAFSADQDGRRQVWVRLLSGGPPLRITSGAGERLYPRWSRDSASILYYSPSDTPGQPGTLWEISALGGTPRRIASSLAGGDISHDDKQLAFFRFGNNQVELVAASRDGSNARVLAQLDAQFAYANPRWSPDDRSIAYVRILANGFDNDIFRLPVGGGAPQRITHDAILLNGFTWSQDGASILFSSSRANNLLYLPTFNLWSIPANGGEPLQLTFGETSYLQPDVGTDGRLVAGRMHREFDVWKLPVDSAPSENVRRGIRVTQQTGHVQTPSASPDGKEVVYLSDTGGHSNLWVKNLASGEMRQVTNERDPQVAVGVPVWSPDGALIAHYRRPAGSRGEVWVVSPDGSNSRRLVADGGWASWSPDGKWLYYWRNEKSRMEKADRETGEAVIVRTDQAERPSVARDGTLYYVRALALTNGVSDLEIRAARPEASPSHVLARISGSRIPAWQLMQPVLSPDGRWLAVLLTDGATTDIWGIPTSGGPPRQLTAFAPRRTFIARRTSWSSDSRFIFAAIGEGDADIVLLDGFSPH